MKSTEQFFNEEPNFSCYPITIAMNTWNQLLPDVIRSGLSEDEADSRQQIYKSVQEIQYALQAKTHLVENKTVGKFARQIYTHLSLKYTVDVSTNFFIQYVRNSPVSPSLSFYI